MTAFNWNEGLHCERDPTQRTTGWQAESEGGEAALVSYGSDLIAHEVTWQVDSKGGGSTAKRR